MREDVRVVATTVAVAMLGLVSAMGCDTSKTPEPGDVDIRPDAELDGDDPAVDCTALWPEEPPAPIFPPPTLLQLQEAPTADFFSVSSPRAIDVNGDGCRDFVFGSGNDAFLGQPESNAGRAVAVDGVTNEIIWQAPGSAEVVGSATSIERQGEPPILVFGGRYATFFAVDAATGDELWSIDTTEITDDPTELNFYTALRVDDRNDDDIDDLIAVYGGDGLAEDGEPRVASHIALVDGATGAVLRARETPDGFESYTSPVRWLDAEGSEHFIFGTGGETLPGSLWLAELDVFASTQEEDWAIELVVGNDDKGFISPAAIADLDQDGVDEIIGASFGGEVTVLSGSDLSVVWDETFPGSETFQTPGVARLAASEFAVILTHNVGVYPAYDKVQHRVLDGATGAELYEVEGTRNFAASPLAVDLNGDGADEVLFFESGGFGLPDGSSIHLYDPTADAGYDISYGFSFVATPLIFVARGHEQAELVVVSFTRQLSVNTWALRRLVLRAEINPLEGWIQYLGLCGDGRYQCDE